MALTGPTGTPYYPITTALPQTPSAATGSPTGGATADLLSALQTANADLGQTGNATPPGASPTLGGFDQSSFSPSPLADAAAAQALPSSLDPSAAGAANVTQGASSLTPAALSQLQQANSVPSDPSVPADSYSPQPQAALSPAAAPQTAPTGVVVARSMAGGMLNPTLHMLAYSGAKRNFASQVMGKTVPPAWIQKAPFMQTVGEKVAGSRLGSAIAKRQGVKLATKAYTKAYTHSIAQGMAANKAMAKEAAATGAQNLEQLQKKAANARKLAEEAKTEAGGIKSVLRQQIGNRYAGKAEAQAAKAIAKAEAKGAGKLSQVSVKAGALLKVTHVSKALKLVGPAVAKAAPYLAAINGVMDAKQASSILSDAHASALKKVASVVAVAGDALGMVPGIGGLIGDGVSLAAGFVRDSSHAPAHEARAPAGAAVDPSLQPA